VRFSASDGRLNARTTRMGALSASSFTMRPEQAVGQSQKQHGLPSVQPVHGRAAAAQGDKQHDARESEENGLARSPQEQGVHEAPTGDHAQAGGNGGLDRKARPSIAHGSEHERDKPAHAEGGHDICRDGQSAGRHVARHRQTSVLEGGDDRARKRGCRSDAVFRLLRQLASTAGRGCLRAMSGLRI